MDKVSIESLMKPYMDHIASVCLFSGKPILKEEMAEDNKVVHWFFQTIRVKFNGLEIKKYRRAYGIRNEELNDGMRIKMLKDLLNIDIDFVDMQKAVEKAVREQHIKKTYQDKLAQELEKDNGGREFPAFDNPFATLDESVDKD